MLSERLRTWFRLGAHPDPLVKRGRYSWSSGHLPFQHVDRDQELHEPRRICRIQDVDHRKELVLRLQIEVV